MVENITNIGQLLIPANQAQAVSSKTDAPSTKRFTINEDKNLPEENTYEVSSTDNKSKNLSDSNERNDVLNDKPEIDKKSNNEIEPKIENQKVQNQQPTESNKTKENCDNEIQPDDQVNPQSEVVVDSTNQVELIENNDTANDDVLLLLEKSNTVTGHAFKSEQIKALHETESGQLGIKTILPENSNGINGLKQEPIPVETQTIENTLTEQNNTQVVSELPANNNAEQISPETFTEKENQTTVIGVFEKAQGPKNDISEIMSEGKSKLEELLSDSKPAQQVVQPTKSHTQDLQELQNHSNEQQGETEVNITQATQESDTLFDGSTGNKNDSLKQNSDIAEVLSSSSIENDTHVLDDNDLAVEQSFANTQINQTHNISSVESDKAVTPDILKADSNNDVSTQISKHITETISSSTIPQGGEKQITVRLNPPELGSVMIKFTEKNHELTGILQVSKAETKAEIEHALPDIIRHLSESGIQLRRIEIVSTENKFSANDSAKEQLMQNDNSGNPGQNESQNQDTGYGDFNNSRFQQWFSNTIEYARGYSAQNQYASSSINMLA